MKTMAISVYLSEALVREIDTLAEKEKRSRNKQIEKLLEEAINELRTTKK
jgi:hypothetical protein